MRRLFLALMGGALLAASAAAAETGVEGITKPTADVTLSFVRPGLVAEVLVKEGDAVKVGDVLVRLDDAAERLQVAELKAQADDILRIKAAQAQVDQKKEEYQKIQWAAGKGAATDWEVARARLEVTIGELSVDLARFNQQQDRKKHDQAVVQLERMNLLSPVAATVEQVFLEKGESAEALAKVVRIVKTDTLWVDLAVPMAQARGLKVGDKAEADYVAAPGKPVEGKVLFVAAVADAASETLTVRVEMPNNPRRPAGERVRVRFPGVASTAPAEKPKGAK